MIRYPCELIEDLIPLYIGGDVSYATKEIIEKHLRNCKNCSTLVQKYSNDEIKLTNFKEDFPQANTFKKWMKKLKVWGLITAVVAIFAAIIIGTIGYKMGDITSVGPIDFKYETTAGGGRTTGMELNKDGYLKFGGGSGNGAMPRENEKVTFTIKWNGKEENIVYIKLIS